MPVTDIKKPVIDMMREHSTKFGLPFWMYSPMCELNQKKERPCENCESNAECCIAGKLIELFGDLYLAKVELSCATNLIVKKDQQITELTEVAKKFKSLLELKN